MKRMLFGLLIVIFLSGAAWAKPAGARLGDLSFVAWLQDSQLRLAFANESNIGQSVNVKTQTTDNRRRPLFGERVIQVPARSVIYEGISLGPTWENDALTIEVGRWPQSARLEIEAAISLKPSAYVLKAGEKLEVDIDLSLLMGDLESAQLVVDDYYQMLDSFAKGPITIASVEGGYRYFPFGNRVDYTKPRLFLEMEAPYLSNVGILTFKLVKIGGGYRGYGETIDGPTVLVYGRNLRLAKAGPPQPPRVITR